MKDELTYEQLVMIAGGHSAFQLLWAGLELGVFAALSKKPGMSRQEIARAANIESQPARILMTGLTALKLVVKDGDSYRNSALIEQFGVPGSPQNMIDVMGWQAHVVYPGEMDFVDALRENRNVGLARFPGEGGTLYQRLAHDPKLERIFHKAMSSLSRSANAMLVQLGEFASVRHLVDLGGGDGTNVIALAKANPDLVASVFDAPSVCQQAAANIAQHGLEERVKTHPGNFFLDDFPADVEGVLLAHIMTIWSAEKNVALLRRAYDALPSGGRVFVFNMMGADDESGPLSTALGSPYFLTIATGEGMLYSWREYEEFLGQAGFSDTRRIELPREHGLLIAQK